MTRDAPASVTFTPTEPAETRRPGIFLGSIATVPFVAGVPVFAPAAEPRRGAALAFPALATLVVVLGCLSLQALDPLAARGLAAPIDFARLRPARMAVPVLCLPATLVLLILR